MGAVQEIRQTIFYGQHGNQIKAQAGHVHNILFTHTFAGKGGMHTAQTAQTASGSADIGEDGNNDPVKITDDDGFHPAGTVNQQPQPAVEFRGQGGKTARRLPADNLMGRNRFFAEAFKRLELPGLESGRISYNGDGVPPGWFNMALIRACAERGSRPGYWPCR